MFRLALLAFALALVTSASRAGSPASATLKVPPALLADLGISPAELAAVQEAAARGDPQALELVTTIRKLVTEEAETMADDPLKDSFSYGLAPRQDTGKYFNGSLGSITGNSPAELRTKSSQQGAADGAGWFAPTEGSNRGPAAELGPLLPHASSYPSILTAIVDDRAWPVIRVKGTSPVVLREKKEKSLWKEPVYATERGDRFAPAWVEVKDLKVNGARVTTHETITATAFCAMTLTSTVDLKGAFVAVLVFDEDFIERGQEWPHTTYLVHALPDLPKGKPVAVEFTCNAYYGSGSRYCLPLIYAKGGAEVSTSESGRAKIYFTTLEKNLHAAAVRLYRAQNTGDHDAAPFQRVNPILPDAPAASAKVPVAATLTIDESGHVTAVKINTPLDPLRTEALDDALHCWLFLPKLKAGQPVPVPVQVTLEL